MKIQELIDMIPKDSSDEAMRACAGWTIYPYKRKAVVTCVLSSEFRLYVEAERTGGIVIQAENREPINCTPENFIQCLRIEIYEIDEAMSSGAYRQSKKISLHHNIPSAPPEMDIPVWDEKTGQWYDAEY